MEARSVDERLPWLDTPRADFPPRAERRGRTPLLILLGLFLAGMIAVMAFLAGRGSAPVAAPAPVPRRDPVAAAPVPIPPPSPAPVAAAPVAAAPVAPTPPIVEPLPPPLAAEPVRADRDRPPATPPRVERPADIGPAGAPSPGPAPRGFRRVERSESAALVPAPIATPVRTGGWAERPFAGGRGRVIQVGAYATRAQADAEWWRMARTYPYLATLPRLVTPVPVVQGQATLFRVRLAAPTAAEARALCRTLHSMRRGCIIV